jgi:hypothetical protein
MDLSETDDKNQIKNRFISSQAFHRTPGGRVRKITTGEQFESRKLEFFDPVTREQYQFAPVKNHTLTKDRQGFTSILLNTLSAQYRAQKERRIHSALTATSYGSLDWGAADRKITNQCPATAAHARTCKCNPAAPQGTLRPAKPDRLNKRRE